MKQLVFTAMVLVTLCTVATTNTVKRIPPEKRGEIYMRKFGGFVVDPRSGKGKIGIVNAQKAVAANEIAQVAANIRKNLRYAIEVREGRPGTGLPTMDEVNKSGFNVAVFVVEDQSLPALLAAPEERWAVVNVSRIKSETNDDVLGKRLFALRTRGEIKRALALACGAGCSSYPGNLYGATCAKELDTTDVDATIMDIAQRCGNWLAKIGVTPERRVMYLRAVQEGWAPQPTNEFQKAIWQKVHAIPDKPITIEFDPKKDK